MAPELTLRALTQSILTEEEVKQPETHIVKAIDVFAFGVTLAGHLHRSFDNCNTHKLKLSACVPAMYMHNAPYPNHEQLTPERLHSCVQAGWRWDHVLSWLPLTVQACRPIQPEKAWPLPECCPQQMFDLMEWCWDENASARPSFDEASAIISAPHNSVCPRLERSSSSYEASYCLSHPLRSCKVPGSLDAALH